MVSGELIILIVIILIIIILIWGLFNMIFANDTPKQFREIKHDNPQSYQFLDTGDILMVNYNQGVHRVTISLFTRSLWVHSALVLRDDTGRLWIFEGANYRNTDYKHFFFIPFDFWLFLNRRNTLAVLKHQGPPIDRKEFLKVGKEYSINKLASFGVSWARFLDYHKYYDDKPGDRDMTCIEMVITVLQKLNVIKKTIWSGSYLPSDVAHRRLEYEEGHRYEDLLGLKLL